MIYGNKIERYMNQSRSVIGQIDKSMAGNIILRVGQDHEDGSWHQTEHVCLTPEEAKALTDAIYVELL